MAQSAILFSYFFRRSSTASSNNLDFGILVSCAKESSPLAKPFFNEDVNLVRFTKIDSAMPCTALHYSMLSSVTIHPTENKWLHFNEIDV